MLCATRESGRLECCKPSQVGSRGKAWENFWLFCIVNDWNIALVALQPCIDGSLHQNQHFWILVHHCLVLTDSTGSIFIQEYFTFSSLDLPYILVLLIRKMQNENKIRDEFTVKLGHSNMLQQHTPQMSEWFQNCWQWMSPQLFKISPMTFLLQIISRFVKCNDYLMI